MTRGSGYGTDARSLARTRMALATYGRVFYDEIVTNAGIASIVTVLHLIGWECLCVIGGGIGGVVAVMELDGREPDR